MSFILLLDSSDKNLSIGIAKGEELVYSHSFYAWQRQSEYMIPEIEKALKELNLSIKDISYIALGIGPGSYTGVRIPMAIAKTLNIINNIKIIPLSSLQILGSVDENYIALMDAKGGRSYIGVYKNGESLVKDQVMTNQEVLDIIDEYTKKGFAVKGNVSYLNIENNYEENIIKGMLTHARKTEGVSDCDGLKPVYLKD